MAKKLVVCCDGTWNTARTNTNIARTHEFLAGLVRDPRATPPKDGYTTCAGRAADGGDVHLFYDEGVGAELLRHVVGGGVGVGLSDNVREAYRFLAHAYEPGAEIYLFGFSRGAYTVRSLCGFIKAAGLLVRPSVSDVWRAYMDCYATAERIVAQPEGWSMDRARAWLVEQLGNAAGHVGPGDVATMPRHDGVNIRFVGVYDTVGALGVPLAGAVRVNEPIVGFHDTGLSDLVEHAVQALAVDERRGPFLPTLWTLPSGGALASGQTVLQVWFPGVHSDVGGGYHDKGIGNITWDFMMRQAARRGLVIDPARLAPSVSLVALPPQHDSYDRQWTLLADRLKILPKGVRAIGPTVVAPSGEIVRAAGEVRLHPSLVSRFGQTCATLDESVMPAASTSAVYAPVNVTPETLPLFA